MNDERGQTLKVLIILSWVWIALMGLSSMRNLIEGPPPIEMIEEAKAQAVADQPQEVIDQMKWFYDDTFAMLDASVTNHYQIEGSYMAIYLLGLAATIFMWRLRRAGFFMYLAYSVAAIVASFYFYYGLHGTYAYIFGGFSFLIGGIFCILYGVQLKRMK